MNREEGGARFWVRLPVSAPAAAAASDETAGSASGEALQLSTDDQGQSAS